MNRPGRARSRARMNKCGVPMRRCVGCMTSFPQKEIVRIALLDGKPAIDKDGRMSGRGAYLCRSMDCFDMAMKKKRLAYAIGARMTADEMAVFREEYLRTIAGAEVNE